MVRIVRNVHNDRHSARHPEASQNAYHCERCVQSELSDMYYQLKTMSYSIIINNSVFTVEMFRLVLGREVIQVQLKKTREKIHS